MWKVLPCLAHWAASVSPALIGNVVERPSSLLTEIAAGLFALFFLLSIPFRFSPGMAGRKLSFQPLIAAGMFSAVIGRSLLMFSDSVGSLYPFVLLLAVYEGAVVLQWIAIGNYFRKAQLRRDYWYHAYIRYGWLVLRSMVCGLCVRQNRVLRARAGDVRRRFFAVAAALYLAARRPRPAGTTLDTGGVRS